MFKEIKILAGPKGGRRVIVITCDVCGKEREQNYCNRNLIRAKEKLAFCSRDCSTYAQKKNNVLDERKREYFLEKFGVESPLQKKENHDKGIEAAWSDESREKREATNLDRFGSKNVMGNDVIKKRQQESCVQNFGYHTKLADPSINELRKVTSLEKYGTEHPMQSSEIKEKHKSSCQERWGVENSHQHPDVIHKTKETCRIKFGGPSPMSSDEVKRKFDWKEKVKRSHQTMKRNKTYGKSIYEDLFFELLTRSFSMDDIERQKPINGWAIDFYVKTINLHIQFDGVYWHGMDRPLNEILKFKNPRDVTIYSTMQRDIEQNEWFLKNNLKLLRVTDKKFKQLLLKYPENKIVSLVLGEINGGN